MFISGPDGPEMTKLVEVRYMRFFSFRAGVVWCGVERA